MPSEFPDALKQYKKFKSMGGAFVLARNGSSWDFQIHPKVMIPRIKAIAREAKGQIIAGKWTFEGGKTNFEITFKKGKLTLNDTVRRTLKNGLELGVQPEISEGSDVEDDDQGPSTETDSSSAPPTPPPVEFEGLAALNSMLGAKADRQAAIDPLADLDFLADIDLDGGSFSGSVKDIAMARLAWLQAEKEAQVLLGKLSRSILADFPDAGPSAKGVEDAIGAVKGGDLVDALEALSNAKGAGVGDAITSAHDAVLEQLDAYETFVSNNAVLEHLDANPYKVKSVRARLKVGIDAIRKNMTPTA